MHSPSAELPMLPALAGYTLKHFRQIQVKSMNKHGRVWRMNRGYAAWEPLTAFININVRYTTRSL